MTKSWSYKCTQDKLSIFVSSRIKECEQERSVARNAIQSLNHRPVLFEHLGAKPYPPRDLYLSRLRDSQVMVAIYRSGYGYIDQSNGMDISGLEDEYQFAKREGIDTLFYIWNSLKGREPRLQSLIDKVSPNSSIFFYEKPQQLYERVRKDLGALITDKILSASSHSSVMLEDSRVVLERTLTNVGVTVHREGLLNTLEKQIEDFPILCIHGPAGIGKTILAAQYAQSRGSKFVRASGLTPKEVFSVCADIFNGLSASQATPFTTLDDARMAVTSAWAEIPSITLVLDECDYIPELIDALSAGGGMSATKRIIYTSRELSQTYQNLEVPQLTPEEIDQIWGDSPCRNKLTNETIGKHTPLEIQLALMQNGTNSSSYMPDVRGSAGEILTYLALTPIPLNAEQLLRLRDDDNYSIGLLSADIDQLGLIVDDSPRGYRLIHAETADTISTQIRKSPQRYLFFVNRLINLTASLGHYRYAYELAETLENGSEKKFINRAIQEAAKLGDWRIGVRLTDRLLSEALDSESKNEALHLMLSLVYPLELMGDVGRAKKILERAQQFSKQLGEGAQLKLEETEISSRARRALLANDVEDLQQIYRRYGEQGNVWDQARIGLELSTIYMATKKYEAAIEILRTTLLTFKKLEDEYGVDLTQRNLASALSAIPGNEKEAEKLIALISDRSEDQLDGRRQRAWICNILTQRLRKTGRYQEAESLAKEAVAIAIELGDESLSAINLINLGNVYRGSKQPLKAVAKYEAAAASSQKCGLRNIEADASRLIAGIYNDFDEIGKTQARREKAKFYAQHAAGLVRETIYYEALASALWELGEALEALGEIGKAASTMFEAAVAYRRIPDENNFSNALNWATEFSLSDHTETYLRGIAEALHIEQPTSGQAFVDKFFYFVKPIMEKAPMGSLIHLLGSHLGKVWSELPTPMRKGVSSNTVEHFRDFSRGTRGQRDSLRVLYSAIVVASLLKDTAHPYLYHRLATSVTDSVNDIFVREEGDGSRVWTLILNLKRRITVTISCLDVTPASNLAGFSLAMFIKAFEEELSQDFIVGEPALDELLIHIASYDHMPDELRQLSSQSLDIENNLVKDPCIVSRPVDFTENSPTIVFLGPSFQKDVSFGRLSGNALQLLFGLTLVEIIFQLLHGEVEMDEIRPKVVSLVRRAQP